MPNHDGFPVSFGNIRGKSYECVFFYDVEAQLFSYLFKKKSRLWIILSLFEVFPITSIKVFEVVSVCVCVCGELAYFLPRSLKKQVFLFESFFMSDKKKLGLRLHKK